MQVPYKQVDVFTAIPYGGNPLAVILDGRGLSQAQMQRIANWTNLSETTFVLPATDPKADYRVRIFTPRAELPFAGHPTLGTAHALLEAGRIGAENGRLVQECGAGLVALTVSAAERGPARIAFELPTPRLAALDAEAIDELEGILGTAILRDPPPKSVTVGPVWVIVRLAGADAVLALKPDPARINAFSRKTKSTGIAVFGAYPAGADAEMEVRAFAPAHGVDEDPVCGSGNGAIAAFIRDSGLTGIFGSSYVSSQGAAVGRKGNLTIAIDGDAIRVGGQSVTCIDGIITLSGVDDR